MPVEAFLSGICKVKTLKSFQATEGIAISDIAFAADQNLLYGALSNQTDRYWYMGPDYSDNQWAYFDQHADSVKAIALSPDGKWAASGDNRGEILIWNTSDKKHPSQAERAIQIPLKIWHSPPNSNLLVSGSDDFSGILWDVELWKNYL